MTEIEERNKALVLNAFDTLFNKRDYTAAQHFWSPDYIQHSAHIAPGREGLIELVKASPPDMRYENALITANGDHVMLHGRFHNVGQLAHWILADIVRIEDGVLAEHWMSSRTRPPPKSPEAGCRCSATPSPRGPDAWTGRRMSPSTADDKTGGSTNGTTEWQGCRDHGRHQRYRPGDGAEVRQRRRPRLHHGPPPKRAG